MVDMSTGMGDSMPEINPNPVEIEGSQNASYEQCREERIKENLQRMQNLGILNLSLKLRSEKIRPIKRHYSNNSSPGHKSTPPLHPSRRSSRLENSTPVVYTEEKRGKNPKGERRVIIYEGTREEVYTEEHEKLLGNTERSWTCFVDGYGRDGKRIYDPFNGKTCHQCRQKTLGHRTQCCECGMVQGQFCGDCLYMRYGEHVLEALENPDWVCPVCRGICNCSLCRNHKGWVPTGAIYRRIAKLGYKSVAHYLIQTKRAHTDDATPNQGSAKRSLSFQEAKPVAKIADVGDDDDLPHPVTPKLQNMKTQNGDSVKEEDKNTSDDENSARRSLSFCLPSEDEKTPWVDVQVVGYLEPPKKDANNGDDVPKVQERIEENLDLDNYLLPVENQALVVYDEDQVLSDETVTQGKSVNTRETRSKKREVALEPNQDSIGARLRQRRRSQSGLQKDEKTNKNPYEDGRSLSLILPFVDDQTPLVDKVIGYTEPSKEDKQVEERTLGCLLPEVNQALVVYGQDQVQTEGDNSVNTRVTRSQKRKVALEPNQNSIGSRLRQRRKSQSGLEKDENTNKNPYEDGKSLSLILPSVDDQTPLVDKQVEERTLSCLLPEVNQALVVYGQDQTETGDNSVNTRVTRSQKRKVAL